MRTFDKNISYKTGEDPNKTPMLMPLITTDFYEETGIKIRVGDELRNFKKYLFTGEFSDLIEYENFLKNISN